MNSSLLLGNVNITQLYCGICMEKKSCFDFISIKGCVHRYCSKCVGRYVTEKIRNYVAFPIGCPYPGCKNGSLGPEYVQKFREDERYEKEDLMFLELAQKQGWKRCPFCRFFVEKVSGCSNLICRCGRSFKYV